MGFFGKVSNRVMYDPDLSLEAKGLYGVISSLSGSNGYCFPKVDTLCKCTNRHRSTIHRLLKELSEKGYLDRHFDPLAKKHIITLRE
jgi:DNA-binding MarR family transcriptional regulator